MEEHRNAVRMFNEFLGFDQAVASITKQNIIDYKQALLKTPNRYTMRFPGLTLPQAIKANQKLAEPISALAPKTINMKWLSHCPVYFSGRRITVSATPPPSCPFRLDPAILRAWA